MRLRAVASVLVLSAFGGLPAAAFENEPDGFGPIRFRMSVEQVQAITPGLTRLTPAPVASPDDPVVLEVYQQEGQSVLGLEGCTVRYYFANDLLYQIAFDCSPDPEVLFPRLKETFGPATEELQGKIYWLSLSRAVALDPRNRIFTFVDRGLNDQVGKAMAEIARLQALRRARGEAEGGSGGAGDPEAPFSRAGDAGAGAGSASEPGGGAAPPSGSDDIVARAAPPAAEGPGEAAAARGPSAADAVPDFDWFDEEKQLQELLSRLDAAKTDEERSSLLYEIAAYQNEDAVPRVAPFLRSANDEVVEAAVSALEDIKGEEAVEAIGSLLGDPSIPKNRRLRAIEAFTYLRMEEGVAQQLAKALRDPDPEVRQEAAMTMALTADDSAVPALKAALEGERDEETRRFIERAVELLAGPASGEEAIGQAREKAREVLWGQPGS